MKAIQSIERTAGIGYKHLRQKILLALIIAVGSSAADASSRLYYAPAHHGMASACPPLNVLYDGVFHTAAGRTFVSQGYGPRNLSLWIGENRHHYGIDAYVQSHNRGQSTRITLFSLPRDLHATARILNANGWQFNHVQDGYRIHVIIDRIWQDRYGVPRCAGRVVITQLAPQIHRSYAHPVVHSSPSHYVQRPVVHSQWDRPGYGARRHYRRRP